VFFSTREAAGASGARHSLRPLYEEGGTLEQNSREMRGEIAKSYVGLEQRHCEERSDEAIHSFFMWRNGLLRGACHRARIRATRWLAMTMLGLSWLFEN
jgi:hypothetical protein